MSRFRRFTLCAMWLAALVTQFGPISSADQGSSGSVQDGLAVIVLVGELVVIIGSAVGWEMAPSLGASTAAAGLAASVLDVGRVPTVAAVEIGMFSIALLVSLEALHQVHVAQHTKLPARADRLAVRAPGVDAWIKQRARRALCLTGAGFALIGVFGVIVDRVESRAERLAQHGVHVDGVVDDYSPPSRYSAGAVVASYRYRDTLYRRPSSLMTRAPSIGVANTSPSILTPLIPAPPPPAAATTSRLFRSTGPS